MASSEILPINQVVPCPNFLSSIHLRRPSARMLSFLPLRTSFQRLTVRCYSDNQLPSHPTVDQLKSQLDELQTETEQARARASTARARFMRLTETVENLQIRAALDVKSGKEESARQLISEKQKVMKALEKSKQRAELLEELSIKLGEAISRKETQLIAALSSARLKVEDNGSNVTNVRIISPREEDKANVKPETKDESLQHAVQKALGTFVGNGTSGLYDSSSTLFSKNEDLGDEFNSTLSTRTDMYSRFLARIDDQLNNIEIQLDDFINVAAMILPEDIGMTTNEKVTTVKQICHYIRNARARIQKVVQQDSASC